ncbi:MAG: metalloregulator ArsR/SmtB family transcription factor [bacterium]
MNNAIYKSKANVIKAIAHPSRLMMIDALAEGEKCVCELQALVKADMSTVSKHLTIMKNAGLVTDRKEGLKVFYRLRLPCVLRLFDCVDEIIFANNG